jgi:hypothetical protein
MDEFFTIVSKDKFERIGERRRQIDAAELPRTLTNWLALSTRMAFCEVPDHEAIQQSLDPTKQSYRQAYPTRWCVSINDVMVCRDCWMEGKP